MSDRDAAVTALTRLLTGCMSSASQHCLPDREWFRSEVETVLDLILKAAKEEK